MSRPNRKQMIIFASVTVLFWFAQYTFVPYLTPYADQLGANDFVIGLMIGIYGLAQILIRVPLGVVSDRLRNRKLFIVLGCATGVAATMGLYLAPVVWLVVLMRFLTGVAASCWVCFAVLYTSHFPPEEAVRSQGLLTAYNYCGQTVGFIVAALVSSSFGMRSTFLVSFFAAIAAFSLSLFITEKKVAAKGPALSVREILAVMKDKWLLLISALGVIFQIVIFAVPMGFTPKLATQMGAKELELALLSLFFTVPAIPVSLLSGRVIGEKLGKRNSLVFSSALMAVCCFLQPLCTSMAQLYIVQMIMGMGRGVNYPILMGLSIEKVPYEKQAAAMGFFQSAYSIGIMMGPIIAGAISQVTTLTTAYFCIGGLAILAPAVTLLFMKNDHPTKKKQLRGTH